jgi:hypothetical protein
MSECGKCGRSIESQLNHDAIFHPEEGVSDEASGYTKNSDKEEFGVGIK